MTAYDPTTWLDLRGLEWQADALCAQTDPEAFFPEIGGNNNPAKRICRECPVRVQCLEHSLTIDGLQGIWGGLSAVERRRLRRSRGLTQALSPCGTRAAYNRHTRAGETPCEPCTRANREYQARYDARRAS